MKNFRLSIIELIGKIFDYRSINRSKANTTYEVIILPKFHKNWAKIVDFLLGHSDFKITFLLKLRPYSYVPKAIDS